MFEFAPISLWNEDFSEVKRSLEDLKLQGINNLAEYLGNNPEVVNSIMSRIRVIEVNRKTLEQFEAESSGELLDNLGSIFRDEMRHIFMEELLEIWEGKQEFQKEGVNYTLKGKSLDILLKWIVMPGSEQSLENVLVSIEDISDRKNAERALIERELHYRSLFENSPVSLWEEDFSVVKQFLDELREQGVQSLKDFLFENPVTVENCIAMIRVLDVNQKTLEMFGAQSKNQLLNNLNIIFRDEMRNIFREELLDLWDGNLKFEREGINYSLEGDPFDVSVNLSVMPGKEQTLGKVLVSITDITSRKHAETYLKFLGTHDVLTGLYNRVYFEIERLRFQKGRRFPVSIVVADVDELKSINHNYGHAVGDDLLRRVGEVLKAGFRVEDMVARTGGDEFAVIMPDTSAEAAHLAVERIRKLLDFNNKYYQGPTLHLSLGEATGEEGCNLEEVQKQADDLMCQEKSINYKNRHP